MRKKTFLKLVSLFACFSILMLSVPGAIASERNGKKFDRPIMKKAAMLFSFFPFLNFKVDKDTTSNKTSDDNSGQEIKITGGKLVNKVVKDG
jgi:hypothetical protein